jgi:ER lumen protein retaining receptor
MLAWAATRGAMYSPYLLGLLGLMYLFKEEFMFSVIFTLSGTVQVSGFLLVLRQIFLNHSVSGLSRVSMQAYGLVFSSRALLFLFYKGYLPYDSTGEFLFQFQEWVASAAIAGILVLFDRYRLSYDGQFDRVPLWTLLLPCLLLAILAHPRMNKTPLADILWALSQYLEVVAVVPQFMVFMKKGGEIETPTSHYLASQVLARILNVIFWLDTYVELNSSHVHSIALFKEYVGWIFIVAQFAHLCVMSEFSYLYIKSLRSGASVSLPSYV